MPQVAIRLDDAELAALDGMVSSGRFPSRAAAIRHALAVQSRAERDREIAEAYARAYGGRPTSERAAGVGAGRAAIAALYGDEPSWDDEPPT